MVAAPVRAHDASNEMRERALDERRVVDELELRLGHALAVRPAKWSERSA